MKKLLSVLLMAVILLGCCALAEVGTMFPWRGYTLNAEMYVSGTEVDQLTASLARTGDANGAVVLIRLTPDSGSVKVEDINGNLKDFVLRDGNKNEYESKTVSLPDINYVGGLSFAEEQQYFSLVFQLGDQPVEVLNDGRLVVETETAGERILVPLVIAEAEEPAAKDESEPAAEPEAEEPAAEPEEPEKAELDEEMELILSALDGDFYRTTYEALLSGETVSKGAKGNTAKGVQQTLAAFGKKISADGAFGSKSMEALNDVQQVFGAEPSDVLTDEEYAELLKWLMFTVNEDAAYDWMNDEREDEWLYLRACVLEMNGKGYDAMQLFSECDWLDCEERAAACRKPWPKNGEIYRNSKYSGKKMSLTFKVNSTSEDRASLFKIYSEKGDLVSCVFVGGSSSAKVKLPGGTYTIKLGQGTGWYGVEDSFGRDGYYETMLFDGGNTEIKLKSGYEYTLTIRASEGSGDSVGAEDENWEDF